jgi:hypothetical protein
MIFFDAKYTEVLIDLGFRSFSGEIQNKRAFVRLTKKQQGDISFMKETFIDTSASGTMSRNSYRIKRNQ